MVYAARDQRLARTIALKTLSAPAPDETARQRLWREARAAASVNHPNVCQIYEIGEDAGRVFIAMELLEGEALAARLERGALTAAEAMPIGLGVLSALAALHARGIVHRDLKPSNVFLTAHGVKLLDFGLAQPELGGADGVAAGLTRTGVVMGTPRYMSPEQVAGEPVDLRSDLFAAGTILFEMLAGRPAFAGRSIVEVLHATRYEQPPALTGSPAVAAVDRVIRRAMAKRPADRPVSADAMADELRAIRGIESGSSPAMAQALTRLVVLPFRVLRPDAETDFLAFSLPDAIATSLSGNTGMIVRSSAVAARFADRDARPEGARRGGRRRSRGDGHAAAGRRSAARDRPARRRARRHAADVAHRPGVARRSLRPAGRHRPPRRRRALAAAGRHAGAVARPSRRPAGLPAVPARQRAGADLRRHHRGARSLPAVPRARSALRAGVGPARTLPSHRREVHRSRSGQRRAGRGRAAPGPGHQPPPVAGAQVLRQPRSGHRPGVGGAAPPAR